MSARATATSPSDISVTTVGQRPNRRGKIHETTVLVLKDLTEDSPFFSENRPRLLPRFREDEVTTGYELGTGEFGAVFEVSALTLKANVSDLPSPQNENVEDSPMSPPRSIVVLQPHEQLPQQPFLEDAAIAPTRHRRGASSVTFAEDTKFEISLLQSDATTEDTSPVEELRSDFDDNISAYDDNEVDDDDDDESLNLGNEAVVPGTQDSTQSPSLTRQKLRERLAIKVLRDGEARFALKQVKKGLDAQTLLDATLDLACEARFLQSITHSNIIRLRATIGEPGTHSFGLLLDRLTVTMDQRLEEWSCMYQKNHAGLRIFRRKEQKEQDEILNGERLLVAYDIARALRHLHRKRILYRDVKPENLGFNVRGEVQIFDFGLARELKERELVEDTDGYEATGLTGSRRFMAPEVVRCLPYGFSADVYSFSILLWQIFALQVPFPKYDSRKHFDRVVQGQERPKRLSNLSPMLQKMMQDGWADDRRKRPSFQQVCLQLQAEIVEVSGRDPVVMDRTVHLLNHSLRSFSPSDLG